jgi:hypothetical protein
MFTQLSLSKRDEDCVRYTNGDVVCYDGFWGSDVRSTHLPFSRIHGFANTLPQKGIIIKWVILALFFGVFLGWFVGGYIHAKRRLKKGLPLLSYHRVRSLPNSLPTIRLHDSYTWLDSNADTMPTSSSSPTPNASATAKYRRITSPFMHSRTRTANIHNTRNTSSKDNNMRNPRHCTRMMRRHSTLRHRSRMKDRAWRCRCMVHRRRKEGCREDNRAVLLGVAVRIMVGMGMWRHSSNSYRLGRSRRRRC